MGVLQAESALAPIQEIGVRHKLRRFTGVRGLGADFPILGSYCNRRLQITLYTGLNFDRPTDRPATQGVDISVTLCHAR